MYKKTLKLTVLVGALFSVMSTQAAVNPIFSCTAKNGKPVKVEKVGTDYVLSYQNLKVSNAFEAMKKRNNTHVSNHSGYILFSLEFADKQDSYYVQYRESMGDAKPLYAGVFKVSGNENPKEYVVCNTKKPVIRNFELQIDE
ncbi:hypothetical protein [Rodentibacter haemolyticus]|uniref:Uncharacterized protein n=1 Tax=Rodentibacter haemolyticus TaxID=2778911 RepID=A0ABX6V005_9PAST|nr:hypothetical protein [Rodentibacter haemolyticus]QPB42836.1 hypothetical protein IHV77_01550 [Rodentibacter haemolyticus]